MPAFKKYIQQNIYKWHRNTSLLVAIPVLMWTISGILHPIMTSFKPAVKNQLLQTTVINADLIKINLQKALQQNNITALHNFRIVNLNNNYYYQIQQHINDSLTYINCTDEKILPQGDKKYAIQLAQKYLGDKQMDSSIGEAEIDECCHKPVNDAIEKSITKEAVLNIKYITTFTEEYKSINKILPVYKVSFNRNDGIRLYIEPATDRLVFSVDDNRAMFTSFFDAFHSWGFLGNNTFRMFLLVLFSALAFFTSLFGFYILLISKKKKAIVANTTTRKTRRWHRSLATVFFITTLFFTASGCYHAFSKLSPEQDRLAFYDKAIFNTFQLPLVIDSLHHYINTTEKLANVSILNANENSYWQLSVLDNNGKVKKKYVNIASGKLEEAKEIDYAKKLAILFSGNKSNNIVSTEIITKFNAEYGFINKRLPVVKVMFNKNHNERYYIEMATGRLALKINDTDVIEGYSFAFLHKHHFWDTLLGKDKSKTIRDISTIVTALGLLLLTVFGIVLFMKMKIGKVK